MKMYIDNVTKLSDLPQTSSRVLYQLIKGVDYNGQIIINASVKRLLSNEIGIKEQSFANALTVLVKNDVMQRIDKGIYILNPFLFAKGTWSDVKKLRKKYTDLKMTYKNGTKELPSSIETNDEANDTHKTNASHLKPLPRVEPPIPIAYGDAYEVCDDLKIRALEEEIAKLKQRQTQ